METIFSNLENLYKFQIDFLRQLESRVNEVNMEESQIGEVFVTSVSWLYYALSSAFKLYIQFLIILKQLP